MGFGFEGFWGLGEGFRAGPIIPFGNKIRAIYSRPKHPGWDPGFRFLEDENGCIFASNSTPFLLRWKNGGFLLNMGRMDRRKSEWNDGGGNDDIDSL